MVKRRITIGELRRRVVTLEATERTLRAAVHTRDEVHERMCARLGIDARAPLDEQIAEYNRLVDDGHRLRAAFEEHPALGSLDAKELAVTIGVLGAKSAGLTELLERLGVSTFAEGARRVLELINASTELARLKEDRQRTLDERARLTQRVNELEKKLDEIEHAYKHRGLDIENLERRVESRNKAIEKLTIGLHGAADMLEALRTGDAIRATDVESSGC